jgi:hypothetical protein
VNIHINLVRWFGLCVNDQGRPRRLTGTGRFF